MPSVSEIRATLTVDDIGWTKGLDKAKRELQRTQREIDASSKQDFGKDFGADKLRTEIQRIHSGSIQSMRDAEAFARFESFQTRKLEAGQGFEGLQTKVLGKGDVQNALAASTAAASGNLASAGLVAGAFGMALSMSLTTARALEEATQGIKEGWGDARDKAAAYANLIPLIGGQVAQAIDFGGGRDIREQTFQRQRAERNALAASGAERARLARDLGREAADAEAEARIAGERGLVKQLDQIELQRQQARRAITTRFDAAPGGRTSPELLRARDVALAAENAKFDAQRATAVRDYNREQQQAVTGLQAEAEAMRLAISHRNEQARLVQTAAQYAERIARAELEHNDALARQLAINRDLALEQIRQEETLRRRQQLRDTDTDIASTALRLSGREQEARALEISKGYEDQINEARRQGNNQLAERLEIAKRLKLEESARQGAGIFQGDSALTARGPAVTGGVNFTAPQNAQLGYMAKELGGAGYDRQTQLLELIAELLKANAPGRLQ